MRADLTPELVVQALLLLCMWAAFAAFVFGALAAELHMWRRAWRREELRHLRAERRRGHA